MSNPFDDLKEDDEETDETDSITETETEDGLKSSSKRADEGCLEADGF